MKKLPELTPREAEVFDVWTTAPEQPDIDIRAAKLGLQPASLRRYLRTLRTKRYLDNDFKSSWNTNSSAPPTSRAVVGGRHGIVVDKLITTLAYTPENNATAAEVASVLNPALGPAARVLECAMSYARQDLRGMLRLAEDQMHELALAATKVDVQAHIQTVQMTLDQLGHTLNELGMRVECLQHAARPVDGG